MYIRKCIDTDVLTFVYIQFKFMKLTQHFLKRSGERDIYPEMLVKILSGKYVSSQSEKDETAVLVTGPYDGKFWTVIINYETGKIISARRAHKKEITKYEEKYRV